MQPLFAHILTCGEKGLSVRAEIKILESNVREKGKEGRKNEGHKERRGRRRRGKNMKKKKKKKIERKHEYDSRIHIRTCTYTNKNASKITSTSL